MVEPTRYPSNAKIIYRCEITSSGFIFCNYKLPIILPNWNSSLHTVSEPCGCLPFLRKVFWWWQDVALAMVISLLIGVIMRRPQISPVRTKGRCLHSCLCVFVMFFSLTIHGFPYCTAIIIIIVVIKSSSSEAMTAIAQRSLFPLLSSAAESSIRKLTDLVFSTDWSPAL